ncbi:MAG TPA: multicopper oxidase family protein [Vicinamibacterales bacterium]|nr:multicopper oxidase family protein [Vicinamibacterales bacterium]
MSARSLLYVALAIASQASPAQLDVASRACEDPVVSLYCAELVPIPSLRQVQAHLELVPPPTAFGGAVTVDGVPRYQLMAVVRDLPSPNSLGQYSAYVAWATSLSLDQETKLGEVRGGRSSLGELAMTQFRVFVTAESSPAVARRTGPIVLRATSPSVRRLAHRDLLSPATPGVPREQDPFRSASPGGDPHDAAHGAVPAASGRTEWRMPPMSGLPMMPGMSALRPTVSPYLPGAGPDPGGIAAAQPRQVMTLAPGAVLDLDARLVRRTIRGRTFVMFGFNGQYPGPLINVAQRSTITVRFTNHLDMPTSVHWHGLRLDNRSDGVPGVTQDPVAPGATFVYSLTFPDAGIYWYHPHVREEIQQDLGLYGNILVAPSDRGYYGPANREEMLILDDFLLDDAGPFPYGREAPTHALMGRFGNVFLVNGEPDLEISVDRGDVVRFYLTNVSSARLYNISFGGARMKVIGSDVGKFEREAWVTSVVLAPAERYIVDVQFITPGTTTMVNAVQSLNHMAGSFFAERHPLARIRVNTRNTSRDYSASFATLRQNADVAAGLAPYRAAFSRPVDRELHLTLRTRNLPPQVSAMLQGAAVPLDWNDGMPMENWLTTAREVAWILREPSTGRENMDVAWRFTAGDLVRIRFFNDPAAPHPMSHPIHIHGQRFLVLRRNDVETTNLVWKDTTIVGAGETVDVLVELSNPGRWMIHCHVAEHLGTGMMTVFQVDRK